MKINIAILEDIQEHYELLKNIITNWSIQNGHIVFINWYQNKKDIINSRTIDNCNLLFSDIELYDYHSSKDTNDTCSNGINICSQLRKSGFHGDIIFLTAFSEYVFEGYRVQAIDYILKPVTSASIERCMNNYVTLHSNDFYYLHKDSDIIFIPYNSIISIYRDGHDCCITTSSELYTERISLQNIAKHLPPQFIRCHKSCIVNINHVVSLSRCKIRLSNRQTQTVGRIYFDNFKNSLLKLAESHHI